MATFNDSWYLTPVEIDCASGYVPDLQAHEGDANGRGINLTVTMHGETVSMDGMSVYLAWGSDQGSQGLTEFEPIDASSGRWKVLYPTSMQRSGTVIARVMIYPTGSRTPITGSRNFRILVECDPVDGNEAMSDNDFSVFQKAVVDLNEALDSVSESVDAALGAAEKAEVAAERAETTERAASSAEQKRATAETERENNNASWSKSESERMKAEAARKESNAAWATAEAERVKADGERTVAQAKNNADQALNNAAMAKLSPYICGPGEYDAATLAPTIVGEANRMYYVPAEQGPGNKYVEWMLIEGSWEMMGVSNVEITAINTAQIDQVAAGQAPTGDNTLNLTGLSYLWAKIKAAFAAADHEHHAPDEATAADVDAAIAGNGETGARYVALAALNRLAAKIKELYAPIKHSHGDADVIALNGSKLTDASVSRAKIDAGLESDIKGLEDAWDSVSQEIKVNTSDCFEPASGWSIASGDIRIFGNVAMLNICVRTDSQIATDAGFSPGTLKSGYRPVNPAFCGHNIIAGSVEATGVINLNTTMKINASSKLWIRSTYVVNR